MSTGFIVWFTGLSGSGKSTLAALISDEIRERGIHVECLDGDEVRKNLSWGLGFSEADRNRNVERIGYVARMVARSGSCAITAAISPYRSVRDGIRAQSDRFCEVYCECPIDVLSDRDPKGLYKRALAGEIKNFTGVDDPYEAPVNPDVHLHTDRESPESCAKKIVDYLEENGFLRSESNETLRLPTPYGGEITDVPQQPEESAEHRIDVSLQIAQQVAAMAAGYLSPVRGFMSQREARRVVKGQRLERGLPWQEPMLLEVAQSQAEQLQEGSEVSLMSEGRYLARLQVQQVWQTALIDEPEPAPYRIAGLLLSVCPTQVATPSVRDLRRKLEAGTGREVPAYFAAPGDLGSLPLAQLRAIAAACGNLIVLADESFGAKLEGAFADDRITVVSLPGGVAPHLRSVVARNAGATRIVESLA